MGILENIADFLSKEAGQRRTQALNEGLAYYVPPELRQKLGLLAEMTPTATIERAGQAGERMMAPDRTAAQRVGDLGAMLSETAGVVAPAMVANRAAMPVAQAVQEGLLGFSMGADDMGRRFVERMNQPGPVPTMYSNPVGLLGQNAKKEVLGSGYGQTDIRLTIPGVEGKVDYSVFEGRPKINMIEVPEGARRKGNASKLLKALQDEFPDTEIDWGMLTEDGSRLYGATKFKDVPSDFADDFAKLNSARASLARKKNEFSDMQSRGVTPPAAFFDEWNDLGDKVSELERALEFERPTKRIIDQPLPTPRNDAEAMAKQVLEMRAAGRAGDVTEEMMAAADPQYMFFNTPLPMDYESRMARADQYFPDTGYHATTADFQAFEPLMRGTATDAGWFGDADYFSPSSQYAERFVSFPAENPLVIPARLNRGNVYDWRAMEADRGGRGLGNNADAALQTRERLEREGFNSVEVSNPIIKADAPLSDELWSSMIMADPSIEMMGRENVSKSLQAGIPRKSLEDYYSAEMLNLLPTQRVIDEIAIFSPNQIRSRFARFDPEFRHLRNLSAGVGGLGLLSYGYPSEEY